jgi:cyclase
VTTRFEFDDLVLDTGLRRVLRDGEPIELSRLTYELLRALVESAPDLLSREELSATVWGPRRIVTDENLTQRVLMLRRRLGDEAARPRYIESLRGHGYRLIPPVHRSEAAASPGSENGGFGTDARGARGRPISWRWAGGVAGASAAVAATWLLRAPDPPAAPIQPETAVRAAFAAGGFQPIFVPVVPTNPNGVSATDAGMPGLAEMPIETSHLAGDVHWISGPGGNIAVLVTEEGKVLVDDQYSALTAKIVKAVEALGEGPIRFVINTHVHPDHIGGNANLAALGIPIVAHDNVRLRMLIGMPGNPREPEAALPILTFDDSLHLSIGGEEISIRKVPAGHTDGDSFVYFETSDVLHVGDVLRKGEYPWIDTEHGGTGIGLIAALEIALEMAGPNTVVLPGHGTPASRDDVKEHLAVLTDVRDRVSELVERGMTLEQVLAAEPSAQYNNSGLRGSPVRLIQSLYESFYAERLSASLK